MNRFFRSLLTVVILSTIVFGTKVYAQNAYELTQKMITTCKEVKSLTFVLKKEERINGKMFGDKSAVKLNVSPFKIYYKQEYPKKGLEMLYLEGQNSNNALINTNGFPWVNVSLDPYGSQMRENQHHTVHKMGFKSMAVILEFLLNKYSDKATEMVSLEGSVKWDGVDCWKITMTNPNFKYENYTVKQGDDLIKIAKRMNLSEHMILEKNAGVDHYSDVSAGTTIQIPVDYAKKMELYLDKTRNVPLMIKVYDDQGLYEIYEYYNVKVNPSISPQEFTQEYSGYGF